MTRTEVKYILARLRTEAERGVEPPELPEGFRESFSEQPAFRGWINYGVTWYVDEVDVWKVILLKKSKRREWEELLAQKVPVITADGVVQAEEWNKNNGNEMDGKPTN